jgi:hypothetical protein
VIHPIAQDLRNCNHIEAYLIIYWGGGCTMDKAPMENFLFWEVVEGPKTFEQAFHVEFPTLVHIFEETDTLF